MPSLPTLDDFNRANGAPGANWGAAISTYSLPNIVGNALDFPQFPSAYWAATTFPANQGSQIQVVPPAEGAYLILRLTNPNTGSESCYSVYGSYAGSFPAEAWKMTAGIPTMTSLGFANGIMQATDKWLQATAVGTTISLYGGSDGSTWNLRQTWTDSAVSSSGYIGVWMSNNVWPGTVDNFGGGSLAVEKQSFYVSRRRTVGR